MRGCQRGEGRPLLLLVVLFVFLFILIEAIPIFTNLGLIFLLFLVQVIGDEVQVHGMGLRDFQLGFALRATQDFAFLDFVFIHIDFGGAFRTADHVSILRTAVRKSGGTRTVPATLQRIIYRG